MLRSRERARSRATTVCSVVNDVVQYEITIDVRGAVAKITASGCHAAGWTVAGPSCARRFRYARDALEAAVQAAERFLRESLLETNREGWGVRVALDRGTFVFGDPGRALAESGMPLRETDSLCEIYRWWSRRLNGDPETAIEAVHELIEYRLGL